MRSGVARRVAAFAAAAGLAVVLAACGGSSSSLSPTTPTPVPTPTTPLPTLQEMLAEKVLGDAAAPITMIEYSSLTCSHCADFHVITLPLVKANYIDTGKVKLVYRDFPLNDAATAAAMVARCSGSRFFTTVGVLYQNQATWAASANYTAALKATVASLGITSDDVDACLAQSDLKSGILAQKATGSQTYSVGGTPTFIINGQQVVGAYPYASFDTLFKSLLGG